MSRILLIFIVQLPIHSARWTSHVRSIYYYYSSDQYAHYTGIVHKTNWFPSVSNVFNASKTNNLPKSIMDSYYEPFFKDSFLSIKHKNMYSLPSFLSIDSKKKTFIGTQIYKFFRTSFLDDISLVRDITLGSGSGWVKSAPWTIQLIIQHI